MDEDAAWMCIRKHILYPIYCIYTKTGTGTFAKRNKHVFDTVQIAADIQRYTAVFQYCGFFSLVLDVA